MKRTINYNNTQPNKKQKTIDNHDFTEVQGYSIHHIKHNLASQEQIDKLYREIDTRNQILQNMNQQDYSLYCMLPETDKTHIKRRIDNLIENNYNTHYIYFILSDLILEMSTFDIFD